MMTTRPYSQYLIPLVSMLAMSTIVWLLVIWLQSGLTLYQKALLFGSVVIGISTTIQGFRTLKIIIDDWQASAKRGRTEEMPGQFDRLLKRLELLPDLEYRNALRGFLTTRERQLLRGGVEIVDRGSALETIDQLRKMNEFEQYLDRNY